MLRVVPLSGDGRYYTAELAPAERGATAEQSPFGDTPGVWLSPGATRDAPRRRVEAPALAWLLAGRDPRGGRPLPGRPTLVSGYDLTFSATKSVSVLLALSDPQTAAVVRDAHEVAVAAGVQYLGDRAVVARRHRLGERVAVRARLGAAAAFTHASSRALDPHLHTHVVVANRVHGVDGRWSALDGASLWSHARAASALYAAQLRHGLEVRLGVAWRATGSPDAGRYEIDGLDVLLLASFSGRRAEILADQAHASRRRHRRSQLAWAVTRPPKEQIGGSELRRRWLARAGSLGVDAPEIAAVLGHRPSAPPQLDEHRFAASLAAAPDGPSRRHVIRAWCDAIRPGAPAVEVTRCVDRLVGDDGRLPEPRRRVSDLVAPNGALRSLGPRPARHAPLEVWLAAARRFGHAGDDRARTPAPPGGVGRGDRAHGTDGPRRPPLGRPSVARDEASGWDR